MARKQLAEVLAHTLSRATTGSIETNNCVRDHIYCSKRTLEVNLKDHKVTARHCKKKCMSAVPPGQWLPSADSVLRGGQSLPPAGPVGSDRQLVLIILCRCCQEL